MRNQGSGIGATLCAALILTACGGGGSGGSSSGGNAAGGAGGWTAGVYQPASTYANRCVTPRSGTDPLTGQPYADVIGSRADENNFLRSWSHDLYLWYAELPDLNPASYTTADYFELLKTAAITPSGQPKDRFHFTLATADFIALAQDGVDFGYGVQWMLIAATPPRRLVVAFVEPGAAAAAAPASLARGAEVIAIDGVDLVNANDQASIDQLNAGLFPAAAGESHSFTITEPGVGGSRVVTLQAADVTIDPVPLVRSLATPTGPVGYILFNDHYSQAEPAFIAAIETLRGDGVNDLVLDLRYNGGGYLDIASEVAYMIAGSLTGGRDFETTRFNDKHPTTDPVTSEPIVPLPFLATAQGFTSTIAEGTPLPSLDLPRVFVLTGPNTCSASESIINGLRGAGIEVIQIGTTTCGKPYGFYPEDNCGTTYFTIQFSGVNDQGFGDYADGFSPQNTSNDAGVLVPGCSVADDFLNPLGDPTEARLAQALEYRATAACSAAPAGTSPKPRLAAVAPNDGPIHKQPWRENRILRR